VLVSALSPPTHSSDDNQVTQIEDGKESSPITPITSKENVASNVVTIDTSNFAIYHCDLLASKSTHNR